MQIKIFCVSDNALIGKTTEKSAWFLAQKLFMMGHKILSTTYVSSDLNDDFKNKLSSLEQTMNIYLVENNLYTKQKLNNFLANLTGSQLFAFQGAQRAVLDNYKLRNIPAIKDAELDWTLPNKAKVLASSISTTQSYVIENAGVHHVVVPYEFFACENVFSQALEKILYELQPKKYVTKLFKTFGISQEEIKLVIFDLLKNKDKISISVFSTSILEADIVVKALEDNTEIDNYYQKIYDKLNRFIYAESDISLSNAVFELLKRWHYTIAVAESATGGEVVSKLIGENVGASDLVQAGLVTYSNQAKINELSVSQNTLRINSSVSVETTYEMAEGLIKKFGTDIVVSTTGYASPSQNGEVGICYIGIGDKNAIHVYKNQFYGNRSEIIDQITKATYFYLIKKLRQNDSHFGKTTI